MQKFTREACPQPPPTKKKTKTKQTRAVPRRRLWPGYATGSAQPCMEAQEEKLAWNVLVTSDDKPQLWKLFPPLQILSLIDPFFDPFLNLLRVLVLSL